MLVGLVFWWRLKVGPSWNGIGTRKVKVVTGRKVKEPRSEEILVFLEPSGIHVYIMSDMFDYTGNFMKMAYNIHLLNI